MKYWIIYTNEDRTRWTVGRSSGGATFTRADEITRHRYYQLRKEMRARQEALLS